MGYRARVGWYICSTELGSRSARVWEGEGRRHWRDSQHDPPPVPYPLCGHGTETQGVAIGARTGSSRT
eukprot:3941716-Rhodomonas_salina.2